MDEKKLINGGLALKFTIIMLSIIVVYSAAAFAGLCFYLKANPQPVYDPSRQTTDLVSVEDVVQREREVIAENSVFANVITPPVRTNFLIVGVDKGEGLTDSIMVGSYISTTRDINLLSIPRDTYIEFSGESLKELRAASRKAPSVMKINAVNAWGGKKYGMPLLKERVEDMLGIAIDYYVLVDLDAFKKIVDSVGGIDFTVPSGGLYYSDPTQDLYINLRGGYQHLNGKQAEGLVRFRKGYAQQDLQRVKVQQEFMKEFVKQALSKQNIKDNVGTMIATYITDVETNFSLDDLPKYIKCIQDMDLSNINSDTLPGYAEMIGDASYYVYDRTQAEDIVDKFFFGSTDIEQTEEETSEQESGIIFE